MKRKMKIALHKYKKIERSLCPKPCVRAFSNLTWACPSVGGEIDFHFTKKAIYQLHRTRNFDNNFRKPEDNSLQ